MKLHVLQAFRIFQLIAMSLCVLGCQSATHIDFDDLIQAGQQSNLDSIVGDDFFDYSQWLKKWNDFELIAANVPLDWETYKQSISEEQDVNRICVMVLAGSLLFEDAGQLAHFFMFEFDIHDVYIRRAVAHSLAQYESDQMIPLLIGLTYDRDSQVVSLAMGGLIERNDSRVANRLMDIGGMGVRGLSGDAIWAVQRITTPHAKYVFLDFLRHSNPKIRRIAIQCLEKYPFDELLESRIGEMCIDADKDVAKEAKEVLGRMRLLEENPDGNTR